MRTAISARLRSKVLKVLQVGDANGSQSIPFAKLLNNHGLFQECKVNFGHALDQSEGPLYLFFGLYPLANELYDLAPSS